MSNQRNADKDREIIAAAIANPHEFIAPYGEIINHYLERSVSAEQRVAELEKENRRLVGIEQALQDFDQPNGTAKDVFMWLESTTNYKPVGGTET